MNILEFSKFLTFEMGSLLAFENLVSEMGYLMAFEKLREHTRGERYARSF